jgi:uncharacterized protein YndB with AHSA1/START domain
MTHEFEIREEITLDATPEQVWDAIATGPGIDSWFMGHTELEPREGGRNRLDIEGFVQESTVTTWEPGTRLAFRSDDAPDGTFMAFEYLIEGRSGGTTVLRFVHSGLLSGDDWEAEYDALKEGDPMYLRNLASVLKHFPGQQVKQILFLVGPQNPDDDTVWAAFNSALGLTGDATEDTTVRFAVDQLPPVEGVVEFVNLPHYVGVRTDGGLYTLMHGHQHMVVVEYHGFSDEQDEKELASVWQSWLGTVAPAAR